MVYQIKKFLPKKLRILDKNFHNQKSKNGLYYLAMTDNRNQEKL